MLELAIREGVSQTLSTNVKVLIHGNDAIRIVWLVLNIWPSHLGLPLLIATVLLNPGIKRHYTLVNMCLVWMIVGISSSLLLYTGHQTGPEPPYSLCLFQASLLYGQPAIASVSAFALVYHIFYFVRAAFSARNTERNARTRKWILISLPYIAFFVFAIWTALTGLNDADAVSRGRRFFYCSVKNSILTDFMTVFAFSVLLATTALEFYVALIIFKHWRVLRSDEVTEASGFDLNLLLRVGVFGTWIILGMGLCLISIESPESTVPDIVLATMASAVVLIFGTKRDVLRTWYGLFKRNPKTHDTGSMAPDSISFADPDLSTTTKLKQTTCNEVSSIYSVHTGTNRSFRSNSKDLRRSLMQRDISQPKTRQEVDSGQAV